MASELYKCKTCAKSFETQGKYNRHLKVHSKPHRCKQCEQGFALGADLNRHIRSRHRLGTEKFACPVTSCQFAATRKDNIKQHLKNLHDWKNQPPEVVPQTKGVGQEQLEENSSSPQFSPHPLLNAPDADDRSQTCVGLYEALALGNTSLVQMFLEAGLDINHTTKGGAALLHCAARAGQISMVKFLLSNGASVNTVDADGTLGPPIYQAILSGNPETVECLFDAGYDYTVGASLPKFLAQCNSQRILYICLSHLCETRYPNLSYEILDAAADRGQASVVRALLASHDDVTTNSAVDTSTVSAIPDILPRKLNVPWRPDKDYSWFFTPLHRAATKGHLEAVQALSRHGLNFYRWAHGNKTPLHLAARNGHGHVVKYFLGMDGVDVNSADGYQRTPLHAAVKRGMTEVVCILLGHAQIKTNCRDILGQTVLMCAALHGHWDIADILLKHGNGNRMPRCTEKQCQVVPSEIMKRLLETPHFLGEAVNVGTWKKRLPKEGLLHLAVREWDYDLLQILSDHPDIDINSKNVRCVDPALGLAAELGQIDAVRILLRHKDIDVDSRSERSQTALQRARINGHGSIVDLLLAHGARDDDAPKDLQGGLDQTT